MTLSLRGTAEPPRGPCAPSDLRLECYKSAKQLLVDAKGRQHVLFECNACALPVSFEGSPVSIAPARVTFHVPGLAHLDRVRDSFALLGTLLSSEDESVSDQRWTATSLQMRDALIALDGHRVGATYRDIAQIIYGPRRTKDAWRSSSTALKDRVRRALKRGLSLSAGGYRELL